MTRFASRSIPNFASSSAALPSPPMWGCCSRASWTSASGLSALIEQHLTDPRTGHNRQPHPTCPVLHPAAGRKPLDEDPLSADSPAHRATRMAPHVIEKAGPGGREKRSTLSGSISRPDGRREQTFGRRAVSLAGAAGTAHVTPSERQRGSWRVTWSVRQREGARTWVQIANPG